MELEKKYKGKYFTFGGSHETKDSSVCNYINFSLHFCMF